MTTSDPSTGAVALHDLGRLLSEDVSQAEGVCEIAVHETPYARTRLIRIPMDTKYQSPVMAHEEHNLLVLEGCATTIIDDVRQTAGSGHFLSIEPGATLIVWNESSATWSALSMVVPPDQPHDG